MEESLLLPLHGAADLAAEEARRHLEEHLLRAEEVARRARSQWRRWGEKSQVYADLIHICCQCKALFWKGLGHPCVGREAPSVRVTPHQFVDMLLFL